MSGAGGGYGASYSLGANLGTSDPDFARRADAAFTDFRNVNAEIGRLNTDLVKVTSGLDSARSDIADLRQNVQAMFSEFRANFSTISKQFEESRRTNWPAYWQLLAVLTAMIAGLWTLINNQITNTVQPVNIEIAQMKSALDSTTREIHDVTAAQVTQGQTLISSSQQVTANSADLKIMRDQIAMLQQSSAQSRESDAESRTNRGELGARVAKLEANMGQETADRRAQEASFGTHLGEIETQFHAVSDIGNLRGAQQERLNAMLWQKAYGQSYPSQTFFPPSMFQPDGNVK